MFSSGNARRTTVAAFLTLRVTPPAHSESLPMRVDGKWQEGTHIVNQSGQGEEGGQGVGALSELFWRVLGPSWGSWGGVLGPSWGPLGALLGPSWEPWRASWGHLGGHRSKEGGSLMLVPPLGPSKPPLGALLEPSWGALGRSWGRLGGLLGPSWGLLGPSWGHLEASEAHRKRNGEKAKIINFP